MEEYSMKKLAIMAFLAMLGGQAFGDWNLGYVPLPSMPWSTKSIATVAQTSVEKVKNVTQEVVQTVVKTPEIYTYTLPTITLHSHPLWHMSSATLGFFVSRYITKDNVLPGGLGTLTERGSYVAATLAALASYLKASSSDATMRQHAEIFAAYGIGNAVGWLFKKLSIAERAVELYEKHFGRQGQVNLNPGAVINNPPPQVPYGQIPQGYRIPR